MARRGGGAGGASDGEAEAHGQEDAGTPAERPSWGGAPAEDNAAAHPADEGALSADEELLSPQVPPPLPPRA